MSLNNVKPAAIAILIVLSITVGILIVDNFQDASSLSGVKMASAEIAEEYSGDVGPCRLRGSRRTVSAGFPSPEEAVSSTGVYKVAVAFVDFEGYPGSAYSPREEGEFQLMEAERYLENMSYGKLNIEFVPYYGRWLRMPGSPLGRDGHFSAYDHALKAVDQHIDFSDGIDSIMIVLPSYGSDGGEAINAPNSRDLSNLSADGAPVSNFAVINHQVGGFSRNDARPKDWWDTAAHEIGHNLGLPDLYPQEDAYRLSVGSRNQFRQLIKVGMMGLQAHAPYNFRGKVLDGRQGRRSEFALNDIDASSVFVGSIRMYEMLAWSRWQKGWLSANNLKCLTDKLFSSDITLSPIASSGNTPPDGVAAIVIPLPDGNGSERALVVESRRNIGYDDVVQYSASFQCRRGACRGDRVRLAEDAFDHEGLLVYEVRSGVRSGNLPVSILPANGTDCTAAMPSALCSLVLDAYPIVGLGQGMAYQVGDGTEIVISLMADNGSDRHTARVIRRSRE